MKNYKIRVMACRAMEQVCIDELSEQTDELINIDIGRIGKFIVLNPEARIELFIESEEVKDKE